MAFAIKQKDEETYDFMHYTYHFGAIHDIALCLYIAVLEAIVTLDFKPRWHDCGYCSIELTDK